MNKFLSMLGMAAALGMSMPPFEMRQSYGKPTNFVHRTKKGPGRSLGVKRRQPVRANEVRAALRRQRVTCGGVPYVGVKLARKVYDGTLGLRGRTLGAAARLAQQNNGK